MTQQKSAHGRKRRGAAPLGGLFVLLALVGLAAIIIFSIRMTFQFLDNDSEKKQFEDLIRPVVMFDPMPFEDPADIEMTSLLQYSMWAALTGEKRGSYEYGDNSELIVPASDLDVAAARLFGSGIELIHQSFGDYDTKYYYDEVESVYNVPVMAQLLVYSPSVEDITREGEYYNLLVGYIPPSNPWNAEYFGHEGSPRPDKRMIYMMSRDGDNYQIAKVRDAPKQEGDQTGGNIIMDQGENTEEGQNDEEEPEA